jgi:predicted small metal-binding protein
MAHQFECQAPDCAFLIRSANGQEVIDQVRRHSEEEHDKAPPEADVVRERMEPVDVERATGGQDDAKDS